MRRSSKVLIGFVAAALTYGSLMAFVGPLYGSHHGFNRYQALGNYHCYGKSQENRHQDTHTGHSREKSQTDLIK